MYLVLIAWLYVTLMMALAEATSPTGSVLGAVVTFVLYGLLPMGIVATSWAPRRASVHCVPRPWPNRLLNRLPPMLLPQPSQMQAAMRPLPPRAALSRRCEKNREPCATVHQAALESLP